VDIRLKLLEREEPNIYVSAGDKLSPIPQETQTTRI